MANNDDSADNVDDTVDGDEVSKHDTSADHAT